MDMAGLQFSLGPWGAKVAKPIAPGASICLLVRPCRSAPPTGLRASGGNATSARLGFAFGLAEDLAVPVRVSLSDESLGDFPG
jgi:hypothetical protein